MNRTVNIAEIGKYVGENKEISKTSSSCMNFFLSKRLEDIMKMQIADIFNTCLQGSCHFQSFSLSKRGK